MTNNLKAERTLTAEELQVIIDGCEKATPGPWAMVTDYPSIAIGAGEYRIVQTPNQNNYRRFGPAERWLGIEHEGNATHIARLDPETVRAMAQELQHLRSQSLSTQQPMGEVAWERMARAQSRKLQAVLHVPGVKDVLHELDWENGDPLEGWDFVRLSALHPNQESGE